MAIVTAEDIPVRKGKGTRRVVQDKEAAALLVSEVVG